MEEGKADVLGLYMTTSLLESGEITEGTLEDYYVTFIASIFRSVRFGATSAHGRANMVRFNYFQERGAFTRDDATGTYRVDFDAMREAMNGLSELILTLQGDSDHDASAAPLPGRVWWTRRSRPIWIVWARPASPWTLPSNRVRQCCSPGRGIPWPYRTTSISSSSWRA